jgi:hypothetical protein
MSGMGRRLGGILALALLAVGGRVTADSISTSSNAANQGEDIGTISEPLSEKVQEDLGDIRPISTATVLSYFHGQATVNVQYTSNAPLYHSQDKADLLIAPTIEGGVTVPLNKYFKVNADIRMEDYTYASHQSLGFYGLSSDADLEYRYKPVWPRIYVGTEPYYYWTYATGNRLTSAVGPVVGVDENISINRGKTLLYMGYHFGQYYSSPGIDTRQAHAITLALTQQIKPDLYAQLYYQWQYSRYTVFGRDEDRNVAGVSFIHQLNPVTFLSLFVNYVDNASNNTLAKYTTVNAGVSLVYQY